MPILFDNNSPDKQTFLLKWFAVRERVKTQFGKRPDLNAILLLIGINEVGIIKESFSKEEKQDLMHVAICRLFRDDEYFDLMGHDDEGWPHYVATKKLPKLALRDQENLLKTKIIQYFEELDSDDQD